MSVFSLISNWGSDFYRPIRVLHVLAGKWIMANLRGNNSYDLHVWFQSKGKLLLLWNCMSRQEIYENGYCGQYLSHMNENQCEFCPQGPFGIVNMPWQYNWLTRYPETKRCGQPGEDTTYYSKYSGSASPLGTHCLWLVSEVGASLVESAIISRI